MHLLHSFHHSQIWLQKGDVHELTWVRSLRRSRISHRSCLRPPKKHWVGDCAARGNAMRSFSFCNLGSSGRLCESGCWRDPPHWALWAVLDAYDVFSNYRKSNHNICSWACEQYSIFSGAHHPRQYFISHSAASSLLFLLLPDVQQNETSAPESLSR